MQDETMSKDGKGGGLDRRSFMKRTAAAAGGAALLGALPFVAAEAATAARKKASGPLDPAELETLDALLNQVVPKDELGPGAVEMGIPDYIQGALEGSYKPLVSTYKEFLATLEKGAAASGADSFATLASADQIKLLEQVEEGKAPGVPATEAEAAAGTFELVLAHTRQGLFGDPMYGGNKDLAGWKLIGFPGIQLVTPERLQEIDATVRPTDATAATYGGTPYEGVPL